MSWKHLHSFEEQRHYLFNAYIRRQLNQDIYKSEYSPKKAPKSEDFRRWLGWLATHGLLHLLGWDHPDDESLTEMLNQQRVLLEAIESRKF